MKDTWIHNSGLIRYQAKAAYRERFYPDIERGRTTKHSPYILDGDNTGVWIPIFRKPPWIDDRGRFVHERSKSDLPGMRSCPASVWCGREPSELMGGPGKRFLKLNRTYIWTATVDVIPWHFKASHERAWHSVLHLGAVRDREDKAGPPTIAIYFQPNPYGDPPRWKLSVRGDSRRHHSSHLETNLETYRKYTYATTDFELRFRTSCENKGFFQARINDYDWCQWDFINTAYNSGPLGDATEQHAGIPYFTNYTYAPPLDGSVSAFAFSDIFLKILDEG